MVCLYDSKPDQLENLKKVSSLNWFDSGTGPLGVNLPLLSPPGPVLLLYEFNEACMVVIMEV